MRVSCVNWWLPWGQAHPDMRQGTGEVHHAITDALRPQMDAGWHDTPALHTDACGERL
jgi:hypothetical protein